MKKVFILSFTFSVILFISCRQNNIVDNACFYSQSFVSIGSNKIPKEKTESIVIDRYFNRLWYIKHTPNSIFIRDFNESDAIKVLDFEEGELTYLYEDYLYNEKFISRAIIENCQKLVMFDIYTGSHQVIEIDYPKLFRICGLNDKYIYLYSYDLTIQKINFQTLEKEIISLDLWNPGYCVESDCFIGINKHNNICIINNNDLKELPIKGIRYKEQTTYIDISNLYYCSGNKIYYAKKDILGYVKGIFTFSIFLDGLGPVKWYSYNLKTNKSERIKNNGGYSFLAEYNSKN